MSRSRLPSAMEVQPSYGVGIDSCWKLSTEIFSMDRHEVETRHNIISK